MHERRIIKTLRWNFVSLSLIRDRPKTKQHYLLFSLSPRPKDIWSTYSQNATNAKLVKPLYQFYRDFFSLSHSHYTRETRFI